MTSDKLKKCPFCLCGGTPYIHQIGNDYTLAKATNARGVFNGVEVGCEKCHFKKRVGILNRSTFEWAFEQATKEWNTRAADKKVEELANVLWKISRATNDQFAKIEADKALLKLWGMMK